MHVFLHRCQSLGAEINHVLNFLKVIILGSMSNSN